MLKIQDKGSNWLKEKSFALILLGYILKFQRRMLRYGKVFQVKVVEEEEFEGIIFFLNHCLAFMYIIKTCDGFSMKETI